ncbi:MAG TPA: hypothetical protein VE476_01115 [Propionibacteriaceae bacterium]|jgi:hypothetical protein|nr:hypothetical protein [Propionibacteriaceae bacterium]
MTDFFDEPRETPRYQGVSRPVSKTDPRAMEMAKAHAILAAHLKWANSPDREHWAPDVVTVEFVEHHVDFFIRNKGAMVARMTVRPVLPLPEET